MSPTLGGPRARGDCKGAFLGGGKVISARTALIVIPQLSAGAQDAESKSTVGFPPQSHHMHDEEKK